MLNKICQLIINKFSYPTANVNIAQDIIKIIIEDNKNIFDVGIFILYDQVRGTFTLPQNGIYNDFFPIAKKQIIDCIQKEIKEELYPNCGLVRYVQTMFLRNNKNECFISITSNEEKKIYKNYYLDLNYGSESIPINSTTEIIFPIIIKYQKQNYETKEKEILHGIIVLDSFKKSSFPINQKDIIFLSKLISFIINANINDLADKAFVNLINALSNGYSAHSRPPIPQ